MSDTETPVNGELDTVEEDLTSAEWDVEVPEADAAEQHTTAAPASTEPSEYTSRFDSFPADVDPADAADQRREVGLDDDDYR